MAGDVASTKSKSEISQEKTKETWHKLKCTDQQIVSVLSMLSSLSFFGQASRERASRRQQLMCGGICLCVTIFTAEVGTM